jgi:hypothetical protein
MNNVPRSFCPQCTADWDRPWYDICPHCHYRFKGYPWWQSPSFIVLLICLPAIAIMSFRLLSKVVPAIGQSNMESFALGIGLFGAPVGALAAAVILALRMGKKGVAIAGWTLLWTVVFGVVSLILCFFSCLYALG